MSNIISINICYQATPRPKSFARICNFQDTLMLLYDCNMGVKFFTHFPVKCPLFLNKRCTLMCSMNKIYSQVSKFIKSDKLLFGKSSWSNKMRYYF